MWNRGLQNKTEKVPSEKVPEKVPCTVLLNVMNFDLLSFNKFLFLFLSKLQTLS